MAAVQVITQLLTRGGSLTRLLPAAQQRVATADRALLQAYCYGLARWSTRLAGVVDQLLKSPLRRKDLDVYLLLQLGVFQLAYMHTAPHAAVNATVAATAGLGKPWARSLVNAVLRNYQRRTDSLIARLSPAARLAHPQWLLELLQSDWPHHWQAIVEANNQQPPMTLRVNSRQSGIDAYLECLLAAGQTASPVAAAPQALILAKPVAVDLLPEFESGSVSVQDAAAQLASRILTDACPTGGRLLDACAAPGGKTAHALESGHWQSVVALDNDESRLQRVRDSVLRLALARQLVTHCADALQVDDWWDGQPFDAILLDAPCTGTGVIRRHPDIKLLRRTEDVVSLAQQQLSLLRALWPTLAVGGHLLYATCSVLKAENENLLAQFLSNTDDAEHLDPLAENTAADRSGWGEARPVGRQIFPGAENMDGFYYALVVKRP